ncbi:Uncharacterized protein ChrSV_2075 [Chromobacterium vaccinii]|nr:Uncharacterized protein ChrSW_2075 [Chromobacterium vaccinii]QND89533.1 Uncharacterized protein ChrSV_2075 [Chromobacterium vaccinii]
MIVHRSDSVFVLSGMYFIEFRKVACAGFGEALLPKSAR